MLDEIMHLKFICRELLNQFSFRSDHFDPQMDVLIRFVFFQLVSSCYFME